MNRSTARLPKEQEVFSGLDVIVTDSSTPRRASGARRHTVRIERTGDDDTPMQSTPSEPSPADVAAIAVLIANIVGRAGHGGP